jgi:hypothetical protein
VHEDDERELDEEEGRLRDVGRGEAGGGGEEGRLRDGDVVDVPAFAAGADQEDCGRRLRY